ncbi:hypothetical protein MMC11_001871 [Xylographa trunciseda]|nr:hypothetical protein [Xylographa trunciseda]
MAMPSVHSQLSIASLVFPSLPRVAVNLPKSSSSLDAVSGIPRARFRVLNAATTKALVVRADASVTHVVSSSLRSQATGLVNGTTSASLMNTPRFDVRLYDGDPAMDASIHNTWTVASIPIKDPSSPEPLYRVESTSFNSAPNHPYAVQVQSSDTDCTTKTVSAASTGSKFSVFMLLDAGSGAGFYLYNPASKTFLAAQATLTSRAVQDDVVAEDVATSFSDLKEEASRYIWQFFLDEDIPIPGAFRIVHDSMTASNDKTTIDWSIPAPMSSSSPSNLFDAVPVSPHGQSQVWTFSHSAVRPAYGSSVSFSITSLATVASKQYVTLGRGSFNGWRVFKVPSPTREQWNKYLFYEEDQAAFLSLDPTSGCVSLEKQSLDLLLITVLADPSGKTWGSDIHKIWKMLPWTQDLADGLYQLIWPKPKDLFLSRAKSGNSVPILSAGNQYDTGQWWNVTSGTSCDGSVLYSITNHLSGEVLEVTSTGVVLGASNQKYGGLVIEANGQTCILSSVQSPSNIIALDQDQKVTVQSRDILARWKLISGTPAVDSTKAYTRPLEQPKALTLATWEKPNTGASMVRPDPAKPMPTSSLRPLEDGVYIIYNEMSKRSLALAVPDFAIDPTNYKSGDSVRLAMKPRDATTLLSPSNMWHVSRDHDLRGFSYLIRSYATGMVLDEDFGTALGADGRQCIMNFNGTPGSNQIWTIERQSRFAFSINSCRDEASIDDVKLLSTGEVLSAPRVTPLLDSKPSHRWVFTPAPSPVTSGIYRLRFQAGSFLHCLLQGDSNNASLVSCCPNWRVTVRPDGLFSLEPLMAPHLYFLSCDEQGAWCSSERGEEEHSAWKLLSTGDKSKGFYLQNAATGNTMTLSSPTKLSILDDRGDIQATNFLGASLGPAIPGSPEQILTLEATPDGIPSVTNFDAIPTSKVQSGVYRITSWQQKLLILEDSIRSSPPVLPKSKRQAVTVSATATLEPDEFKWKLEASGNGFYTISQREGLLLCQVSNVIERIMWPYAPSYPSDPTKSWSESSDHREWSQADVVGVIPDYNATRWKLIRVDNQSFHIVNKASGDMLQIDESSGAVFVKPDIFIPQSAIWKLEWLTNIASRSDPDVLSLASTMDPITLEKAVNSTEACIKRELDFNSGVFLFEVDSLSQISSCMSFPEHDVLPKVPGTPQMPDQVESHLEPVDLEPYSIDKGLQYWTVEKDDEAWYSVENYLYGYKLAAVCKISEGRRVFSLEAPSIAFVKPNTPCTPDKASAQWKFIQVNGRVHIINRACDGLVVGKDNSALRLNCDRRSASCWWNMTRISGIPAGLNIAEGVYSISLGADRSDLGKNLTGVALGVVSMAPEAVSVVGSSFLTKDQSSVPKVMPLDSSNNSLINNQLWYLGKDKPKLYSIRTLSGSQHITANGSNVGYTSMEQSDHSSWLLVPNGSRYAILSVDSQGTRLALGMNKQDGLPAPVRFLTMNDLKGAQRASFDYLWDLTREGIYIQGAQEQSLYSALAATDSGTVTATSFKPFEAFQQLPDSQRSIWHILFQEGRSEIQLINEHSLTEMIFDGAHIQCKAGASGNAQMTIKPSANAQGYDLTFVGAPVSVSALSVAIDLQGPPVFANPQQALIGGSQNRAESLHIEGAMRAQAALQSKISSWNLIPIASVLAGPLVSLPLVALAPGEIKALEGLDDVKSDILYYMSWDGKCQTTVASYKPGLAEGRFRLFTYGSLFMFISESSRRAVAADTENTVALPDVKDDKCWLMVTNNKVVSLSAQEPKYWQIVMNISDIAERQEQYYIILGSSDRGYPIVLSVQENNLTAVPFDSFDSNQLWRYYDWGSSVKLRVIVHAATHGILTTDLKLLTNIEVDPFLRTHSSLVAKSLAWVVDVDFTLTLQKAGLARHIYLNTSTYVPKDATRQHLDLKQSSVNGITQYLPALCDDPPADAFNDMQDRRGCRFLSTPTAFDLSTKAMVIDNIVAANAPVFLHHHMEYLPIDVAGYLPRAALHGTNGEVVTPLLDDDLQDRSKSDWSLSWNPPPTQALPGPVVYVRLMRCQDVMFTGFTDIEYSMFYPPIQDVHGTILSSIHGWTKVSLRLDNDTAKLDSVLFNGNKRIGNIDTSFSNLFDPQDNPLVYKLTPSGSNRLHVFVSTDPTNPLSSACPLAETPDLPSLTDWKTADGKAGALDASTCYHILQASMIKADDKRGSPVPPAWTKFSGKWASSATNPYGPMFASPLKWSPQIHDAALDAARNRVATVGNAVEAQIQMQSQATEAAAKVVEAQAQVQAALATNLLERPAALARAFAELHVAETQLESIKQQEATLGMAVEAAEAKATTAVTLNRAGWIISADSFQPAYEPVHILDGDPQKIWHTQWDPSNTPLPHMLTIDMQKPYLVKGLTYLPRQDGSANGCIGQYSIEASTDGKSWPTPISSGTWPSNATLKEVSFASTYARYLRLTSHTEAQGTGYQWSSCAEINVLADPDPAAERAAAEASLIAEAAQRAADQVRANAEAAMTARATAQAKATEEIVAQERATAEARATEEAAAQARAAEQAQAAAIAIKERNIAQARATEEAAAQVRAAAQAQAAAMAIEEHKIAQARAAQETAAQAREAAQAQAVASAMQQHALDAASQARASAQAAAQAQAAEKARQEQAAAQALAAQEAASRARAGQAEAIAQAIARAHAIQEAAASPFIGFIDAATYGPKDVTPCVKALHTQWISQPANLGKPFSFTVGNDTLQGDPTPGVAKSCAVLYRRCHKDDPINTGKALTLFAAENQSVTCNPSAFDDNAADHEAAFRTAALLRGGHVVGAVEMAMYGPRDVTAIVQDLFAHGVASPELAAAASRQADAAAHMRSMLVRGLAVREIGAPFAFTVANDVFRGDPAPGVPKSCEVLFRKYEAGSPVATSAYVVLKGAEGARIVFE